MNTRTRSIAPSTRWLVLVIASLASACMAEVGTADDPVGEIGSELRFGHGIVMWTEGTGLNVRSRARVSASVVDWLAEGTTVRITCQTTGDWVEGTNIWNYIGARGGYVTDAYLYTGTDGFISGIPRCGSTSTPTPTPPPSGSLGSAVVTEARRHLGYVDRATDCQKFSEYFGDYSCPQWCSDFVRYVWSRAGADVSGITAYSGTVIDYGVRNGTWHTSDPRPGDALLWCASDLSWCDHIGIVTEVSGSTFRTIHGNFHVRDDGLSSVYETGFIDRWNTVGTRYYVQGFVSPVRR